MRKPDGRAPVGRALAPVGRAEALQLPGPTLATPLYVNAMVKHFGIQSDLML